MCEQLELVTVAWNAHRVTGLAAVRRPVLTTAVVGLIRRVPRPPRRGGGSTARRATEMLPLECAGPHRVRVRETGRRWRARRRYRAGIWWRSAARSRSDASATSEAMTSSSLRSVSGAGAIDRRWRAFRLLRGHGVPPRPRWCGAANRSTPREPPSPTPVNAARLSDADPPRPVAYIDAPGASANCNPGRPSPRAGASAMREVPAIPAGRGRSSASSIPHDSLVESFEAAAEKLLLAPTQVLASSAGLRDQYAVRQVTESAMA